MKEKPKALVFFDLDGTLLTRDVTVAQRSIDAIQALKANHCVPIIATGRTRCEVAHIMQASDIDSIISMNGQSVYYKNEEIYKNDLDPQLIDDIYQFSKTQGIALSFYNATTMRVSEKSLGAVKSYAYLHQEVPPVDPTIYWREPIQMLLLLCESGEEPYFDRFPELTILRNTPFCVDLFYRGGSKAFGIEKLLEATKFHDVPTYAFGDGLNDLEMFQAVDFPIAMGNACDELKSLAKFITEDNDHDGIAVGLKWAGLID